LLRCLAEKRLKECNGALIDLVIIRGEDFKYRWTICLDQTPGATPPNRVLALIVAIGRRPRHGRPQFFFDLCRHGARGIGERVDGPHSFIVTLAATESTHHQRFDECL
jgi:hypothetical protein